MKDAMKRETNEEEVAVKLANYVLDREGDPDADICILARQFLRKRETIRSLVAAAGGHAFVPSSVIAKANDPSAELLIDYDAEGHGYNVTLVQR